MIRTLYIVAISAALVGCGGSSATKPAVEPKKDPAAERKARLASVNTWVDQMWSAYVQGQIDPYRKTLGKDLFSWGTSIGVTLGFEAAVKEATADFLNWKKLAERKVKIDYRDVSRKVGLSADNKKAWVITEKEVIVRHPEGTSHMALVATALLVDRGGVWKKVHSHTGARVPLFAIRSSAKRGPLPKPTAFASQVAPGAQPLVDLFRGRIGDFSSLGGTVGMGDGVQFGFGMMGTYVTGGDRVRKVLGQLSKGGPKLVPGELRAQLVAPDVGWVSANVIATFSDFTTPFRVSMVYERQAAGWRVVQMHMSFAHGPQPPLTNGAKRHPCSDEASLRSTPSEAVTLIRFRNVSKDSMQVHWLDENGKRKKTAALEPGAEALHKTWPTYVYVLSDASGKCQTIFQPTQQISSAVWLGN